MNRLEKYALLQEQKKELFLTLIRKAGRFSVGPTNRGGIWLKYEEKEVSNDLAVQELRNLRDLITDFLVNVVEEP